MPSPVQIINGNRYDFSSIEVVFDPSGISKVVGIKEINYDESLEPGDVYGTNADPIGRTRGVYKAEGGFTIYLAEWSDLLAVLASQPPPQNAQVSGYLEYTFNMTVSYAEDGQPLITDRLIGCRIKKLSNANSQGKDASVLKADLSIMKLLRNRNSPLSFPVVPIGVPSL